jgi:hypothetical protein
VRLIHGRQALECSTEIGTGPTQTAIEATVARGGAERVIDAIGMFSQPNAAQTSLNDGHKMTRVEHHLEVAFLLAH